MPGRAEPLLVARDVRKTYRTEADTVEALRGIDLTIWPGELVMVMGPSGNGKTTMLNCLSGLDDIDAGTVVVDGIDLHGVSDARRTEHRARRMGFVFQSFNLIPRTSAFANVELPMIYANVPARKARRSALEMLDRVGLRARATHRPAQLSGGEQQRVAIARALVAKPAIVWADEPTGNLDSQTADAVLDLLLDVHRSGHTLVVVTHDRAIGALGPRLLQVRDGRIVADGPP